jgi:two-component system LytT family response regulator
MKTNLLLYKCDNYTTEQILNFSNSFTDNNLNTTLIQSIEELSDNFCRKSDTILLLNATNDHKELLNFLQNSKIQIAKVIILTEQSEHIYDFIKYQIFDFLTLPIDISKLLSSINKAFNIIQGENTLYNSRFADAKFQKFITLNSTKKIELIKLDDIVCFEADGRYTAIYLKSGIYKIASRNLGEFQKILDPDIFCRIHHKYIINMNNLINIIKSDGFYCEMINNKTVPVSKRRLEDLNIALNISKSAD